MIPAHSIRLTAPDGSCRSATARVAPAPVPAAQLSGSGKSRLGKRGTASRARAFTLVEIMVAIAIFTMMMGSIIACWKAIVSGAETGQRAAAMAQRARTSMRAIEDSLNNLEISKQNIRFYYFIADTSTPQFASLSFAARLPSSFLGSDYFGDSVMRRVVFDVEKGADEKMNLVMTQYPLLAVPDTQYPPKSIILARDVSAFVLEFWSPKEEDWLTEFLLTNEVPPMIRITLGTGHLANDPKIPFEVISRIVVPPIWAH
jgi:prepilin-type N-terminal cleavage/methylation domain-containing protein